MQAQIAAKQRVLMENLERIGKVAPKSILPPLADSPWGYRRKARLSVKFVEKKGRVLVGFRESNGRYVADIARCEVLMKVRLTSFIWVTHNIKVAAHPWCHPNLRKARLK